MLLRDFSTLVHCKMKYYYSPIAIYIFSSRMSCIVYANNRWRKFALGFIFKGGQN